MDIDPNRAYNARETERSAGDGNNPTAEAPPVIRKVHRKRRSSNPIHCAGYLPWVQVEGKQVVIEYEPDKDLRDTEQVPLLEEGGIEGFLRREVLPYAPDAWYLPASVKTGYEISFTRYFYKPQPLRPPHQIWADIAALERETEGLLGDIFRSEGVSR